MPKKMPKKGNNGSNTFDASQMRMHLKQHIEQVGDLMTTTENIEEYAEFLDALNDLNRLTEDYYTLSPEGTCPLMTEEGKKQLQTAYQNAMKAAGRIVLGEETGAVNAQLRTLAGALLPMLETDNAALEMTNVSREPVTLPALIGNDPKTMKKAGTAYFADMLRGLVPAEELSEIKKQPQFFQAMCDFSKEYQKLYAQIFLYTDKTSGQRTLRLDPGCNVDKRNAAMSAVSSLVGKKGLIAEAQPMIAIINGKPVAGTFMTKAFDYCSTDITEKKVRSTIKIIRWSMVRWHRDICALFRKTNGINTVCNLLPIRSKWTKIRSGISLRF